MSPNDATAPIESLQQITKITGKPTMVTEFSFIAMDSGLPNTTGAARPVATQQDLANWSAAYVQAMAALASSVDSTSLSTATSRNRAAGWTGKTATTGSCGNDFTLWEVLTSRTQKVKSEIEALYANESAP